MTKFTDYKTMAALQAREAAEQQAAFLREQEAYERDGVGLPMLLDDPPKLAASMSKAKRIKAQTVPQPATAEKYAVVCRMDVSDTLGRVSHAASVRYVVYTDKPEALTLVSAPGVQASIESVTVVRDAADAERVLAALTPAHVLEIVEQ